METAVRNVSIAFVSMFCLLPNLSYNYSQVTNFTADGYYEGINVDNLASYPYFFDLAIRLAVQDANNNPDLLPGIHVNLKEFSNCGSYTPGIQESFNGNSGGYAVANTVKDIVETHKDVLGVVDYQHSKTANSVAEAFTNRQIPHCSSNVMSPKMSDRNKYSYFWRTVPSMGLADHITRIYQFWGISRVAIIIQQQDTVGYLPGLAIIKTMEAAGITVLTKISLPNNPKPDLINYANLALKNTHTRYILVSGQTPFVCDVLYGLGKLGWTGPDIVWMAYNTPTPYTDPVETYGPEYYQFIKGFIVLQPFVSKSSSVHLYDSLNARILNINQYGDNSFDFIDWFGLNTAYDCVFMMLMGFDRLLRSSTVEVLASRQLHHQMNYSLFQNLKYNGLTDMNMQLNSYGEITNAYMFLSFFGEELKSQYFGQTTPNADKFNLNIFGNHSVFYSGNIPPPDGPSVATSTQFILSSANSFGLYLFFLLAIFLYIFGGRKEIVRSSPTYIIVTLVGSAAFAASLITICLICLGCAVILGSAIAKMGLNYILLVKRQKVSRLFNARIFILRWSGFIVLLEVAILTQLMLTTNPTSWSSPLFVMGNDNSKQYFLASYHLDKPIMAIPAIVYNGLLLFIAIFMALITRGCESYTGENAFVSVIVALFAVVGGLTSVLVLTSNESLNLFAIQMTAIWILAVVPLVVIIGPKAIIIHRDNETWSQLRSLVRNSVSHKRTSSKRSKSMTASVIAKSSEMSTDRRFTKAYVQQKLKKVVFSNGNVCHVSKEIEMSFLGVEVVRIQKKFSKWQVTSLSIVKIRDANWLLLESVKESLALKIERVLEQAPTTIELKSDQAVICVEFDSDKSAMQFKCHFESICK
ncbi:periplasmic binding protein-like I [Obelidium mucronatum]|nr:periplasmic binding protein-like I [Obelidium mucronatum]